MQKKRFRTRVLRKLIILGAAVFLLAGIAAGAFGLRHLNRERKIDQLRDDGFAAHAEGEHAEAMRKLVQYQRMRPDDRDAEFLLTLARARMEVEEPLAAHLNQAVGVLREYRRLVPEDREVAVELVELFVDLGQHEEAMALGQELLELELADEHRVTVLWHMSRAVAATRPLELVPRLELLERAAELDPSRFAVQTARVSVILQAETARSSPQTDSPRQACVLASELRVQHEDDPRFASLEAFACVSGEGELADLPDRLMDRVRTRSSSLEDEDYLHFLTSTSDALERPDVALEILVLAIDQTPNRDHARSLLRRLYTEGLLDRLASVLESLDDDDDEIYGPLKLIYDPLVRRALNEDARFADIAQELESFTDDYRAEAWSKAHRALGSIEDRDRLGALALLTEAVSDYPSEPLLRSLRGDVLASLRRYEEAREAWGLASALSPQGHWPSARAKIIRSLIDEDRPVDAFDEARSVLEDRRRPGPVEISVFLASASAYLNAGLAGPEQVGLISNALDWLGDLPVSDATGRPDPIAVELEREALPIRVTLLEPSADLEQQLNDILSSPAAAAALEDPTTRARVASRLRQRGIALPQELSSAEEMTGQGVAGLIGRAVAHFGEHGDVEAAVSLIESEASVENEIGRLALIAEFLDLIAETLEERRRAAEAWADLLAAAPDRLDVLAQILTSINAATDPQLIENTVEAFRRASGLSSNVQIPEIVVAESRAVLFREYPRVEDVDWAIGELESLVSRAPTLLPARIVLADLLLKTDVDGRRSPRPLEAIPHLEVAVDLQDPYRSQLTMLRLTEAFQAVEDYEGSRQTVRRLIRQPRVNPSLALRAAQQMIRQGDLEYAIELLESLRDVVPEGSIPYAEVELANALDRLGRSDQASAAYLRALELGLKTPSQVLAAASFFARRADTESEQRAMAQLDSLSLNPGQREASLGLHARGKGDLSEADRFFALAIEADPEDLEYWSMRIDNLIAAAEPGHASALLEQAIDRFPAHLPFRLMLSNLDRGADLNAGAFAELVDLLENESADPRELSSARALAELQQSGRLRQRSAVLELAASHPQDFALQMFCIRSLIEEGSASDLRWAAQLAEEASSTFPLRPQPPQLASSAHASLGNSESQLQAAKEWRRRAPLEQFVPAELAIADALINLERGDEAYERLAPIARSISPGGLGPMQISALRLLVESADQAGRVPEVISTLKPFFETFSDTFQDEVWLWAYANNLADPDEANEWIKASGANTSTESPLGSRLLDAQLDRARRPVPDRETLLETIETRAETLIAAGDPIGRHASARAAGVRGDIHQDAGRIDAAREKWSDAATQHLGIAEDDSLPFEIRIASCFDAAARAELAQDAQTVGRAYSVALDLTDPQTLIAAIARNNYVYYQLQDAGTASEDYDRLLGMIDSALAVEEMTEFAFTRAELARVTGRLTEAEESYRSILQVEEEHVPSMISLAWTLLRTGGDSQIEEARRLSLMISEIGPSSLDSRMISVYESVVQELSDQSTSE